MKVEFKLGLLNLFCSFLVFGFWVRKPEWYTLWYLFVSAFDLSAAILMFRQEANP